MITKSYVKSLAKTNPFRAMRISQKMAHGYLRAALSKTYSSAAQESVNWSEFRGWESVTRCCCKATRKVH